MNKNHFYIGYAGNKRTECKDIYDNINFNNIETIVEPYCGTCAISYYISLNKPNMKYIFNDSNHFLKEMYEILIDDIKIDKFEEEYNKIMVDIDKIKYLDYIKTNNTVLAWYLKNKIYTIRPGLFPNDPKRIKKDINLRSYPIYNFFRNNNIKFYSKNGVDIIEEYKNKKKSLIILDPPYINTSNQYYDYKVYGSNVYEYLNDNNINDMKCKILLILEDNYIIKLIFKSDIKNSYNKLYQTSKKKTTHLLIYNYEL